MLLFTFGRLGEASNPGPPGAQLDGEQMETSDLWLGTFNPAGLISRAPSFLELPRGTWGVAETQLTQQTFHSFNRDLRWQAKSLGRSPKTVHGGFAPLRTGSETCGAWTGVAFLSDYTLRPLQMPWRGLEYLGGRALGVQTIFHSHRILGGVVYAPPSGPTFGSTAAIANDLLRCFTENLVHGSSGFRWICGDFNKDPQALATFDVWRAAGWVEAQEYAEANWGRPRIPTSKGSAFSDHLWLSPELVPFMKQVEVFEEVFVDHAALGARFSLPCKPILQCTWPTPSTFPWSDSLQVLDFPAGHSPDRGSFGADSSTAFAKWSASTEHQMVQTCLANGFSLPHGIRGRGQTTSTLKRPLTLPPPRHGRQGDEEPKSSFMCRALHQWFKQLRRFQAYMQRSLRLPQAAHVQHDQACTWRNIWTAPGFAGGFPRWWQQRSIKLHGSPDLFPQLPPTAQIAKILFYDFRANYRRFEQWQNKRRKQLIEARAFDHNKLLFAQVKGKNISPPDHFTLYNNTQIATLQTGIVVDLADPVDLPDEASWTLQGSPVTLRKLTSTQVEIDTDLILAPGRNLQGKWVVSSFQQMEEALAAMWSPIWMRHAQTAPEVWDRALQFAEAYLPRGQIAEVPWTGPRVQRMSKAYKKTSATGPDGWSRADIANLSDRSHEHIATMY